MNQPPRRRFDVLFIFVLVALGALVAAPLYGYFYGYSLELWIGFVLLMAWNGLSITAGYHRLWSHRSYEAHPIIRVVFALGGALALQNSIRTWCSNHRTHHQHVDAADKDPYAATKGLWFSHMGWMLADYPASRVTDENVKDLLRDPIVRWQDKHYWSLAFTLNVLLTLFLGYLVADPIGGLLLMGFVRLFLCHHTTFFINSLAHYWGSKPYSDDSSARDNPVVALLTYGEGYHNFHHTFQWDYRNGLRWYQFDPTKWLIRSLSLVRLTSNLKRVAPEKIAQKVADTEFRRAADRVMANRRSDAEDLLQRLEDEYTHLTQVINDWAECRQRWIAVKRADFNRTRADITRKGSALAQRWEETDLRLQLKTLEARLELQRHRFQMLTAEFA